MSETSLKTSPRSGAVNPEWLRGQDAQIDPAKTRYLVVPGALTRSPWNVKLGDVGIAFDASSSKSVPFIVGDGGGLGEGSVSLLASLLPNDPPKLKERRSALGETVMRYTSGIAGDFRLVIFTNTSSNVAGTRNVTTHAAADLNDWIDATANKSFQEISIEDVKGCTKLAPSIRK